MKIAFEDEVRVVLTLRDGSTKVVECVSLEVAGAVKRRAPSSKALKAPEDSKGAKRYMVGRVETEHLVAMMRGDLDTVAEGENENDRRQRVIQLVCDLRRRAFKLGAVTYNVRDAAMLGSAMATGLKPSTMAKAITMASRDPFWRERRDLSIRSLVEHGERLAAAYTDPSVKDALQGLVASIGAIDPAAGEAAADEVATAKDEAHMAALLRELQGRLAKLRKVS